MKNIIKLEQVSFAYNRFLALQDVNLEVAERDFIGVIGPNGGGKTTLLRLLLGLLKPLRGTVSVLGRPPEKVRHAFGYVPQISEMDIRFPLTVRDVVAMGTVTDRSLFPWLSKENIDLVVEAMKAVDIDKLADRTVGELSSGQRQRCLIARAIVSHPQILLLDEPTASVDSTIEYDIYNLLRSFNKTMTILLVSHDLGFITSYVNKVVCINRKLVCHAVDEITVEAVIRDVYQGDVTMIGHRCKL